jgi:hypothetical protein
MEPWMDIVDALGVPELEAKWLFERFNPTKPVEERRRLMWEMIQSVKAEYAARG